MRISKRVIGVLLIIVGLVLFLDEIWMFGIPLGGPGWLIGNWSFLHVEPFHHWMLGVALIFTGGVLAK